MDKLRLRFEKTGRAVYISHLDLMHTMQRVFSRAGVELKYSEGFNQHPQISIALPLSVGTASFCELMDFKLKEDADLASLPEKLTAVMPEGLRVTECYEPETKTAALKYLEIEGRFEYDTRPLGAMCDRLRELYSRDSIGSTTQSTRGLGGRGLRPAIREISFEVGTDSVKLHAVISAQEPTLNPALLADALRQLSPELAPDFEAFTRLETYTEELQIFR